MIPPIVWVPEVAFLVVWVMHQALEITTIAIAMIKRIRYGFMKD